jgi:hypothetical protein
MTSIMQSFKAAYAAQWGEMERRLEPQLVMRLREMYGV